MSATLGLWVNGGIIIVDDVTLTDGAGHSLVDKRGLFVVHAALLHTGKVLWFCGHVEDGHYALKSYVFDYDQPDRKLDSHDFPLHNPALARGTTDALHEPSSENPASPGDFHADLFCSHLTQAADGRLIVVGGSDPDYHGTTTPSRSSVGERYIYAFDPMANNEIGAWQVVQNGSRVTRLAHGRWYPTAVTLGDGRIAVFSGRREFGVGGASASGISDIVEILTPGASGNFTVSTLTGASQVFPIYPGLHLAPNGRIYYTHTTWGLEVDTPPTTMSIEITSGATSATWDSHPGVIPTRPRREEGMSVLLPPAQHNKILLFGGSEALAEPAPSTLRTRNAGAVFNRIADVNDPTSSEILSVSSANPSWSAGPTLRAGRINGHGVILPDKKVLIFGGHNSHKWNAVAANQSLVSEIYDPATNTTSEAASLNHARMYHAAAVLLPNGAVLIAGGADPDPNRDGNRGPMEFEEHLTDLTYPPGWAGPVIFNTVTGAGIAFNRKDYEIYYPPYCFVSPSPLLNDSARPDLGDIKRDNAIITRASYGDTISISTPQAGAIDAVALMRPCVATHHTDTEQRYVELAPITHDNASQISVTLTTNRDLAPPGYYMLWIVAAGKPCKRAKFILLGERLPAPPASPNSGRFCIVVTAAMGSRQAPEVRLLQGLRTQLATQSLAGRQFIVVVNALYYSVSPRIARAMWNDADLRDVIRSELVRPSVSLIQLARARTRHRPSNSALIAILAGMGLTGILLSPAIALWVAAKMMVRKLARRNERHRDE